MSACAKDSDLHEWYLNEGLDALTSFNDRNSSHGNKGSLDKKQSPVKDLEEIETKFQAQMFLGEHVGQEGVQASSGGVLRPPLTLPMKGVIDPHRPPPPPSSSGRNQRGRGQRSDARAMKYKHIRPQDTVEMTLALSKDRVEVISKDNTTSGVFMEDDQYYEGELKDWFMQPLTISSIAAPCSRYSKFPYFMLIRGRGQILREGGPESLWRPFQSLHPF